MYVREGVNSQMAEHRSTWLDGVREINSFERKIEIASQDWQA